MENGKVQSKAELESKMEKPEEAVAELIRLLNNAKSKVSVVSCEGRGVNSSRIQIYVDSVPFFPHGSKVIVYHNSELPFFIGFSSLLFPDLADIFTAMKSAKGCINIVRREVEKESNLATLTWLVTLLEKDEKFRMLMETLATINSKVEKYGREKDKVRYVKKLLESLG